MGQRHLDIEEFNNLLQQWNGQTIKVIKEELEDKDEIFLDLHEVSYAKGGSIDDYIPEYSVKLIGSGMIETTTNQFEDLPTETFEIPLEEDTTYQYDGTRFFIQTSRGNYTIERS